MLFYLLYRIFIVDSPLISERTRDLKHGSTLTIPLRHRSQSFDWFSVIAAHLWEMRCNLIILVIFPSWYEKILNSDTQSFDLHWRDFMTCRSLFKQNAILIISIKTSLSFKRVFSPLKTFVGRLGKIKSFALYIYFQVISSLFLTN